MTNMKPALGQLTISFLEAARYKADEIARMSPATGLQSDLKLDGDDLIEVLELLASKFGIDMSRFRLEDYGHDEGFHLSPLRLLDRLRGTDVLAGKKVITLATIEESLKLGRWPAP
jgi:hypothetical protein